MKARVFSNKAGCFANTTNGRSFVWIAFPDRGASRLYPGGAQGGRYSLDKASELP